MVKDYYKIMAIPKNATATDVKKAYRTLALKYHPDKNDSPRAEELFKELGEAYEVLSDQNKRLAYDMELAKQQNSRTAPQYPGANFAYPAWTFFGHAHCAFHPNVNLHMKPPARLIELEISLEDIFSGTIKKVKAVRKFLNISVEKEFCIRIKRGASGGKTVTLRGEGDYVLNQQPGDLVFILREKPHAVFSRVRDDLKTTVTIQKNATILGSILEIPTISSGVKLLDTHGIKHQDVKRLKGLGLPVYGQPFRRGDIIVEFNVV